MREVRPEFQSLLGVVEGLPPDELPRFIGEIEVIRCTALARLTAAVPQSTQVDHLLPIDQAASRLSVSKDYLYRHNRDFPFTRRIGRKLLFSSKGIEQHIKRQDSLTARRQTPSLIKL